MLIIAIMTANGCAANRSGKSYVIKGKRYHIMASANGYNEKGKASWYGEPFHGRKTASGEVYDMNKISAAHKTLPLQTWVEVKNHDNGKSMVLRINDRGPFVKGRIIDLSKAAAQEIGMLQSGVAKVTVKAISEEKATRLAQNQQKDTSVAVAAGSPPGGAVAVKDKPSSPKNFEGYAVKINAGTDYEKAGKMAAMIARGYPKADIIGESRNSLTNYHIIISRLKTKKEADKLRSRLNFKGYEAEIM